jgi:hypothetical protein
MLRRKARERREYLYRYLLKIKIFFAIFRIRITFPQIRIDSVCLYPYLDFAFHVAKMNFSCLRDTFLKIAVVRIRIRIRLLRIHMFWASRIRIH